MNSSHPLLLILVAALGSLFGDFGVGRARTEAPPREDREIAAASSPEGPRRKATADTDANDWPAYKHDVARSGATGVRVPTSLAVLWSTPGDQPPRPAWSEPGRALNTLDFDYAFQPVAAYGLVLYGSSADDSVRAFDAATGKLAWIFTTGGPVRFAPHLAGGRCYFSSDDGCAYCVEARTGKEIWRFRAALDERRLLANGRLTSRWPCRSGVLVHDDRVYVTAGMWPSEGVYLFALDARTGRPVWCNDTSCYDYVEYPHAPSTSFGGPAPQGYLLLGDQTLVVPTGRCAPAGFDARTGKLLHFWSNSPNRGGTWATLAHERIFVSAVAWQPDQPVRLGESPPHRADSVAALALRSGKEEWPLSAAVKEFTDELRLPRWRSQIGHGIFGRQRVIFQGKRFYALGNDRADAFEITGEKTVRRLWSVPCPRAYSEALAGNALLVGSQDRLLSLDPQTGKTLADISLSGQVRGLAAAGGRVFATTERGALYALGADEKPRRRGPTPAGPKRTADSTPSAAVAGLIRAHGAVTSGKGFAVVVGAKDARLAQHLAAATPLHIICLLPEGERVDRERQRLLAETSLYGYRLAVLPVHTEAARALPFVSYFANLVVVAGKEASVPAAELYRVLRPCGGRMVFLEEADHARILRAAALPQQEVKRDAGPPFVVRGKLPGAFDWDSKALADERVRWPLEFQWFGEPNGQLLVSRHSRPRTPLPANGRLFIFGESHLTAVDAYNGTELWRRRLSVPVCTGQQPVSADDDFLYVQDGSLTWQLEAGTGKLVKAYGSRGGPPVHSLRTPLRLTAAGKKGEAGTIAIEQSKDGLVISLSTASTAPTRDDRWELAFDFRPAARRALAPAAGTFELIIDPWQGAVRPHKTFPHPGVAIRVEPKEKENLRTVVLTLSRAALAEWLGYQPTDFTLAADVKLWTDAFRPLLWGRPLAAGAGKRAWLNEAEAVIALATATEPGARPGQLSAYVPVTLAPAGAAPALASRPGRLPPMTHSRPDGDYSADFKEGLGKEKPRGKELLKRVLDFELLQRRHPLTGEEVSRDYSRSYGCSGTSCSAAMDFFRSGTIGMYDRLEDAGMRNISGIRSGCGQTLVPAFGMLLYSESASDCLCSYSFATSLALAPAAGRRNEDWALFDDSHLTAGLIRQTALNLGAPGDRRDEDGTLWLGFPRPPLGLAKRTALNLPYALDVARGFGPYRVNTDRTLIENTQRPWLYGSGVKGITRLHMDLVHHQPSKILLSVAPGKAPSIDGKLDDACWDGFGALPLVERHANVFFRHDPENLYVAYEQQGRVDRRGQATPWKAKVPQKDGSFEKDDHFRLSFCNANGKRVVTFAVTAAGGTYDALLDLGKDGSLRDKRMPIPAEDAAWDGKWTARISRDATAFRAELAIPWKTLTDAGLRRAALLVECTRRGRWGGARDASLAKLLANAVEIQPLEKVAAPRPFVVRLHFAELDDVAPGERVFDVVLQGKTVLKDFDIVRAAGGRYRAVVREFRDVRADRQLDLRLVPKAGSLTERNAPALSAVEVWLQPTAPR